MRINILLILILSMTSCEVVKPYQRAYLNSDEMKMEKSKSQVFEQEVHAYREGSEGGGAGKGGGGCGCN